MILTEELLKQRVVNANFCTQSDFPFVGNTFMVTHWVDYARMHSFVYQYNRLRLILL